jgi:hypothetical protein
MEETIKIVLWLTGDGAAQQVNDLKVHAAASCVLDFPTRLAMFVERNQ